jgi:hypothetical protein
MKKISERIPKDYICSIIVAAAMLFMLCIYEPLTIYFQNKIDYSCDVYVILPEAIGMFLIITAGTALVLAVVRLVLKKIYVYVIALMLGVYISLYIQGNYLISDLPVLDGRYINWEDYRTDSIISVILWCVVIVLCLALPILLKKDKFLTAVKYAGLFITAMLAVTMVTVCIQNDGLEKKLDLAATSKNMLDYSDDTNFILLVMDSMDAGVENDILKEYPEYEEALSDFTFYDNVTGAYITTVFEIPYLCGGEVYEDEEDFEDYRDDAFMHSDFINELQERDYRLQAFSSEVPLNSEDITMYENVIDYKASVDNHVDFCKVLLRMTGYKYAPYFLKRYSQIMPGELESHLVKPQNIRVIDFSDTNKPFYLECLNYNFNISSEKCFKLIHLSAAHYPFEFTKDVEYVTYSSYEDNMACSNTIIATYINKLKEEGIYDNSVIFITADHGISEDNDDFKRMNPVLFVKGINEHHDSMQTSSAPISHEDFKEAYFRLLDGAESDEIFDWNEQDTRERKIRFGYSPYSELTEYIQTGQASDVTTLKKNKVYEPYATN